MGKVKKNKKKKRHNSRKKIVTNNPKSFFKKIGIKPLLEISKGQLTNILKEKFGQETADECWQKLDEGHKEHYYFWHTNLELAKMKYGNDFDIICDIAHQIKTLPIKPNMKILDIGGGAGHLSFYMADYWDNVSVTVADQFPNLGIEWAHEIGEKRVHGCRFRVLDIQCHNRLGNASRCDI